MIIIICDGSSRGNPGPASIGVIVWDRSNHRHSQAITPHFAIHENIGIATNIEAEWHALLHAIRFACERYPINEEIYIYSDCQVVVKQANQEWKTKGEKVNQLFKQFKVFKDIMKRTQINWLPRQLVYLADKEAQKGGK